MHSLRIIEDWPADHAAAAVVDATGMLAGAGELDRPFRLASVTKLLTAYAVLIAVEEGALDWDQPAGPAGSTVRHLIAHASGLAFDKPQAVAAPGTKRLYSNAGFELLAETLHRSCEIPFPDYLAEAVFTPLGMTASALDGSPAADAVSTVSDLTRFTVELQAPQLTSPETVAAARRVAFPELAGVLPGFGYQRPNDWGLGFELRDRKSPHWTGSHSSPETFGHFGQSGTFLWVDPAVGVACIVLTDRDFGPWAVQAWPPFTDAVLAELGRT